MAIQFLTDVNADSGTLYVDSINDRVGIGTTSPTRKLQVIGTDGAAKFYYNSSFTNAQYSVVDIGMMTSGTAANGFGPKITFRMGGNGFDGFTAGAIGTIRNGADGTHNMTFATSTSNSLTTKMTITNSGDVGIGTTGPGQKLDVVGTIRTTNGSGEQASLTGSTLLFPDASTTTIGANAVNFNPGTKNLIIGGNSTKWDAVTIISNTYRWSSGGILNTGELNISSSSMDVDVLLKIEDQVDIENLANATSDTDKFLVSDNDRVKYRTGAQLAADIGAVTGGPFLPLAPTGTDVITGDVRIAENKYFRFGASANAGGSLIIGHTNFGSPVSQILENGTGDLKISATNLILESANAETYIDCNFNSSVDLYHNNVKKFETTSTGVGVTGNATFLDSGKAIFGTGSDLEIYHDGSNNYIESKTAGQNLIININELNGTEKFKIVDTNSSDSLMELSHMDFTIYNDGSQIIKATSADIQLTNSLELKSYTATAVSTTGPLNANQNNQAPTQDTLATLSVDPSGNVVRGEQEATFTFTLAQLNSTLGQTLISAPGADKAVVITYTDWMMKYSSTGTTTNNLEIRQANLAQANASVSVLPALRFNEIVNQSQSGSAPFYGFYTRDIPTGSGSQGRTYAVNKATTIHKQNSGTYPAGLTSISIKIRYRIFDVDTF